MQEVSPYQAEQLVLCFQRQHLYMAQIKRAVLCHLCIAVSGFPPGRIIAEQDIIHCLRLPCAAINGDKGILAQQALVVDALCQHSFAAAHLAGQQDGGRKAADEKLAKNQSERIKCGDNGIFKGVPRHEAPLVKLTPHFTVHLNEALPFLKRQHGTFDLLSHKDGGHIDHNGPMVDIQQESVCLLAVEQRIRQNILIQVGKHSGNLLSKQGISAPAQQIVGDPVDPADDALFIHLDDAAECVVQQGVYLGRVVLFQINGVSHAGGSCKGIA